jgi:EAL domain-containing protein (putative c-di-GMP-specific phosphodiesterase class I)
MPNAVYEPRTCIRRTLVAAERYDFPIENIIFEFTETESVRDKAHLRHIIESYKAMGFRTAIDDFGAGYSGLSLIADVVPDIIKIDRELVTGIHRDRVRRSIVANLVLMCEDLGIDIVAEGIEERAEAEALRELGIHLLQGFYLARPSFESLIHAPASAEPRPAVSAA